MIEQTRRSVLRLAGALGLGTTGVTAALSGTARAQASVEWTYGAGNWVVASPTVVDETVYGGSASGRIFALDPADGSERWTVDVDGGIVRAPAVTEEIVYVGSGSGTLHALSTGGDQQWTFDAADGLVGAPTVVGDTVYVGSADGSLYGVNAADGTRRWRTANGASGTDDVFGSSPTVVDDTVYVGGNDGAVYALDAETGDELWATGTDGPVSSSPTVTDDLVIVGSEGGSVYALDAADGTEQWTHGTGDSVHSSPTVADDVVTIGSNDGFLYRLALDDGAELDAVDLVNTVSAGPTIVDDHAFASVAGFFVAVDTAAGEIAWVYETGSNVAFSSPTVADGTAYVGGGTVSNGNQNGTLYAIDAGVSGDSGGTRVRLGTLGHGDAWARAPAARHLAVSIDATTVADGEITGQTVVENHGVLTDEQAIEYHAAGNSIDTTTVTVAPGDTGSIDFTYVVEADDPPSVEIVFRSEQTTDATTVDVTPASYEVSVDATNAPVAPGEELTVEAAVENAGDAPGNPTVELRAAGEVRDSTSVELVGDERRSPLTLVWTPGEADAGDVELVVAAGEVEATRSVTVAANGAESAGADDDTDATTTGGSGPGFGPAATVGGVGAYAYWQVRRGGRTQDEPTAPED